MEKLVPLISSGIAGPLGILHLPRLWQKALLASVGRLADGYQDVGPGYDHMVLQKLAVDPDKAREFIRTKKPTYFEFEAWLKTYPGVKLDPDTIAESNAMVEGYHHKDAIRHEILQAAQVPDDGTILDAVRLNMIDDMTAFHDQLVRA